MPFEIKLIFDSEKSAKEFVGWWLDGGGEQQAELYSCYEESDKWDKQTPKFIRVKESLDEVDDVGNLPDDRK